jgi:hypothetical protein
LLPAAVVALHVFVILQLLQVQITPDLETPTYTVLKATRDYELRRYQPFIVAETPMPRGASECGEQLTAGTQCISSKSSTLGRATGHVHRGV